MKNGFVVFGDSPDEARLVKCGLRLIMKKAVVVQGPIAGGKVSQEAFESEAGKVYDLEVGVDLASGQVTMKIGRTTVTAKLAEPPARISWVGCGALGAAVDFAGVEVATE